MPRFGRLIAARDTKILTLTELTRLNKAPNGPVLIHLTQTQLESALAHARRGEAPRRAADVLVIHRLPGGGALVHPQCRGRTKRACDSRVVFVRVPTSRKPLARYICNCLKATTPKLLPCYVNWVKLGSLEGPGCFPGSCSKCFFVVYGSVLNPELVCQCQG